MLLRCAERLEIVHGSCVVEFVTHHPVPGQTIQLQSLSRSHLIPIMPRSGKTILFFVLIGCANGFRPEGKLSSSFIAKFTTIGARRSNCISRWALSNDEYGTDERDKDEIFYSAKPATTPEGYLSADFNAVGDGKQIRVLVYIALALLPCLALIPFFLSRDFVPPTDPSL